MPRVFVSSAVIGLVLSTGIAQAQAGPAGLWRQVDDVTGKDTSLVRVVESDGVLSAKIEKLLVQVPADARCTACAGNLKNAPIVGLTIVAALRRKEGDKNVYEGGEILDPDNGKSYQVRLTLSGDGKTLDVRGYIGTPLFGRTQTWIRLE